MITISKKIYYNQHDIIGEIRNRTDCSTNDIRKIINTLGEVVKDKFGDGEDFVEIKIFPGLKVTSKKIPSEQSPSVNLGLNSKNTYAFVLSSYFTDDFKRKIRASYIN